MKKPWVLSFPLGAQQRHWSNCTDLQADLSLCWMHMSFCWFCRAVAKIYFSMTFSDGSYVPESCCDKKRNRWMCTGRVNITEHWPPRTPPPVLEEPRNYTLYTKVSYFSISWFPVFKFSPDFNTLSQNSGQWHEILLVVGGGFAGCGNNVLLKFFFYLSYYDGRHFTILVSFTLGILLVPQFCPIFWLP